MKKTILNKILRNAIEECMHLANGEPLQVLAWLEETIQEMRDQELIKLAKEHPLKTVHIPNEDILLKSIKEQEK